MGLVSLVMIPAAQGAGSARVSVSLAAPASAAYGSTIKLTGRVTRYHTTTGVRSASVVLQRSVHAKNHYGNLASTRTSSAGSFAFSVKQVAAYDYRIYFPGNSTYARAYSPVRYPVTNRAQTIDSIATTNADLGELTVTGHATPAPANGAIVALQQYLPSYRVWATIASGKTSAGKVAIKVNRPGSVAAYRLMIGSVSTYGPGISPAKSFAHYVWRNAFAGGIDHAAYSVEARLQSIGILEDQPGQNSVHSYVAGSSGTWAEVGPKITGCREARQFTRNFAATGLVPPRVGLLTSNSTGEIKTLPSDTTEVSSSIDLTGSSFLNHITYLQDNTASSSANILIRMQLRCAN
ncbi:hypothetical protein [Kribbella sp. NPDC004536]|uniref:hypothetical protein n=1 Tax=Kribbella sp. NPDC004536 TaxID=3364106 RepID=UPI0036C39172